MITITRKGLYLSADNTSIPSQGSSDVKVLFNNDTESYQDYLIEPRVGYYVNGCPKSVVCEYSIDTKMINIPKEAFNQNGVLVIAIALIDNNDSNHIEVTKPISFEVSKAPNEAIVLPNDDTWQTAVDNLVKQLFNKDYAPQFSEALNEINEAVNTANTASQNATDALDKSNETNQLINDKIEDGSFIPDISMTAVSGDTTSIERTGTKEAPVFNLTVEKGKDGEGIPIASIFEYAGLIAPSGYLLCQGQAVSRTTYADLFKIIGSTYGSGDDSTTFNLPNLKGRVPAGLDSSDNDFKTLGKTGGEKTHQLVEDEIPIHNHSASTTVNSAGAHTHGASTSNNGSHSHSISGKANSAGNHGHSTYYLSDLTNNKGDSRRRGVASANNGNSSDNVVPAGAHTHTLSGSTDSTGGHTHTTTINSGGAHTHSATTSVGNSGGGQAHNNLQPYIVLNYIIKY